MKMANAKSNDRLTFVLLLATANEIHAPGFPKRPIKHSVRIIRRVDGGKK